MHMQCEMLSIFFAIESNISTGFHLFYFLHGNKKRSMKFVSEKMIFEFLLECRYQCFKYSYARYLEFIVHIVVCNFYKLKIRFYHAKHYHQVVDNAYLAFSYKYQ